MSRATYGVLAIAQRHPALFGTLTKPREPEALRNLTDAQRHARAQQEVALRANRLRALPSCFGSLEVA